MAEQEQTLPAVGEQVLYVPCAQTHWNDTDSRGERAFRFEFVSGPPLRSTGKKPVEGDPVQNFVELGAFTRYDEKQSAILTASEHLIRPAAPLASWPATVVKHIFQTRMEEVTVTIEGREERVFRAATDERLALEIKHPNGYLTLYYPLEGKGALKPGKDGHSWHQEGE